MVTTVLLLLLSFVMILAGAFAFTNSVEWAGIRLGLGLIGNKVLDIVFAITQGWVFTTTW